MLLPDTTSTGFEGLGPTKKLRKSSVEHLKGSLGHVANPTGVRIPTPVSYQRHAP